MTNISGSATRLADDAKDHPALAWAARLGMGCYGLVYLLVGWLTAQLALGHSSESASTGGALTELAHQPLGNVMMWIIAAGFAALVVWELLETVGGHRDQEGLRRVGGRISSGFRVVVFAFLGFTAARLASGGVGDSGGSGEEGWTAKALGLPYGPALVAVVGVGIAAFGLGSIVIGLTDRWRKQLDVEGRTGTVGAALTALARTGYVARGVSFGVVGGLVVWAAVTHDAKKSGGLDEALATLRDAPAGTYLLLLVALGLACFGVFNIAKVVHLRDA